ncbi:MULTISPECIES: tRNA (adenosine(37)-N6)-dimethylallyltransferase MiaA [Microbacterium]|mgnify:FL=1|uniref:tRNA (adenosine(37)-N6)-dimethylallyltransferase MiaA n=1 Tax=Microbacterium TaxID=33882 RepID=UPI000FEDF87F|nr:MULTISPECIES: tRNA (adenosine(37)-N6)-dimethylallyltransferase MiaA [Microbacterium]RKE63688.1 tRNA dimethylallyltransferase [Microbacterium sp. AG238]WJM16675.1 tRNA (adenosine(37)-N6)-dimethylallyltransferase MiaA [Microbacterium arborescens]
MTAAPAPDSAPADGAPILWAVLGATGTGKTGLSLDLAEALVARGRSAEIVNVDAMQLYRGMDIGTAKIPETERRGIPHHLFDALEVTQEAAVAWYQEVARRTIEEIRGRGADAILVGGSGLYASSVLFDFRFPPRDERLRASLEDELERHGAGHLFARLRAADPAAAERIDARNGRRIVRALEVLAQGGRTHGGALPEAPEHWSPRTRIIGTAVPRDELVPLLDARVERMWAAGLVDEVAVLRQQGLERGATAGRAIGYAQALAQLRGDTSEEEAIAETQALTRRYARRQVSWFKRYDDVRWVDPRTTDAGALVDSAVAGGPVIDARG